MIVQKSYFITIVTVAFYFGAEDGTWPLAHAKHAHHH